MVPVEGMKAEHGAGNAVTGMNRLRTQQERSGGQRIGPGGGMSIRSFTGSLTDVILFVPIYLKSIHVTFVLFLFFDLTGGGRKLCRLTLARVGHS